LAKRAKRATRANPRQDRNLSFNDYGREYRYKKNQNNLKDNVIEISNFRKSTKRTVEIVPRNVNQEDLVFALADPSQYIVFATGPAGCGKTLLATLAAIKALKAGEIEKIVITRPNVAVDDKDIGFLPGDIIQKMTPWMLPIIDAFSEYYTKSEITAMLEEGIIEMIPVAYMRGRTFKHSFIIFDEAQNSTPTSMLSVLTRIGENSKMVVTGDIKQGDRGPNNGLADFLKRFENSSNISVIKFDDKDVERHPIIKEVLNMYKDIV
jgi:phosphate starvation-inducible protein PhoH and related proteins